MCEQQKPPPAWVHCYWRPALQWSLVIASATGLFINFVIAPLLSIINEATGGAPIMPPIPADMFWPVLAGAFSLAGIREVGKKLGTAR